MGKGSKIIVALVLVLVAAGAVGPTLTASAHDPGGCTPGFWKQPHHLQYWPAAFSPDDLVQDVFNPGDAWSCLMPNGKLDLDGDGDADTLLDALNYGGGRGLSGMARILLRAAVARLLNVSASPEYSAFVLDQVSKYIGEGCQYGERAAMEWLAEQYDQENNAGVCTVKP